MLVWDQSYSVGNTVLDRHHARLFDLVNKVTKYQDEVDSNRKQIDAEHVHELLNDIADFAAVHFEYEENVLEGVDWPELGQQQAEHTEFIEILVNMLVEGIKGKVCLANIQNFLKDWLLEHVLIQDMKYKEVFDKG